MGTTPHPNNGFFATCFMALLAMTRHSGAHRCCRPAQLETPRPCAGGAGRKKNHSRMSDTETKSHGVTLLLIMRHGSTYAPPGNECLRTTTRHNAHGEGPTWLPMRCSATTAPAGTEKTAVELTVNFIAVASSVFFYQNKMDSPNASQHKRTHSDANAAEGDLPTFLFFFFSSLCNAAPRIGPALAQ